MEKLAVIILAAGKSTRMKSKVSKVLHNVAGRPLITYPISSVTKLKPQKIVVVIADGKKQEFESVLGNGCKVEYAIQKEALGTGHAVMMAEKMLKGFSGQILIIPGDVPLIFPKTLRSFVDSASAEASICSIISTELASPASYGRILRDSKGRFTAIREAKDATDAEKEICEINSGIFLVDARWLFESLKKVKTHNAQKEYYLTDIIEQAVTDGLPVSAHCFGPSEQFIGVNDRSDLAEVGRIMFSAIAEEWMVRGVSIPDPEHTYIDVGVEIDEDTSILPGVHLRGDTVIGKGCHIDAGSIITDSKISDGVKIKPYSVLEECDVRADSTVGPFTRLRPGAVIGKGSKIGNFVEIKKSVLGSGVKASHLSYIGDADIGADTNVGCGTITCNYDGVNKHRTVVGNGAFIGSDVQFVAPVKIGAGSVIGAGSTITKDVPAGALALSRTEQVNIKGYAARKQKKKK